MSISNKTLYTLEIKSTKYLPIIIAVLYIVNTTFSFNGYDIEEFATIGGMSLLPLGKLYLDSFTYKQCIINLKITSVTYKEETFVLCTVAENNEMLK